MNTKFTPMKVKLTCHHLEFCNSKFDLTYPLYILIF